ncbi:uncharacterized protein K452DRAFT_299603 [Aplosporella prunicola CBS 121167]|uniref:Uncharacterized protein n=1 Tax=Aplosporella prunicola CBS 121167 TaxID=1176127 RepID=A0A6A6BA28_9PEZI|nr:uncharacterized protein K452DRAFT_299603 [Aplosporella prunicola CBS 121167]KAF2140223.1 hypothetical protein K452DRAFT_299603 [Aplosporella prunicola CBS 121167]
MSSQVTFAIPHEDERSEKLSTDTVRMSDKSLDYDPNNPTLYYPFLEVASSIQPRPLPEPMGSCPSPPPRHPDHTFDPTQVSPPCSPKTLRPNSSLFGTPLKPRGPRPDPSPPRATSPRSPISKTPKSGDMDGPYALTGLRTKPRRDVRKTVAALRRMNSDANDSSRSSRRYLMMGREKNKVREREDTNTNNEIEGVGLGIGIALGNESCMSFAELAMTGHASIFGSKEYDEGRDSVTGEDHGFWTNNLGSTEQDREKEPNLSSSIMQTPTSKLAQQTAPPPAVPSSAPSSSKTSSHVRKRSHGRHNSRSTSRPQSQSQSQPQSRAQTPSAPSSQPQTPFQKKANAARHSHHRSKSSSTSASAKKHSYVFVDGDLDSDAENRAAGNWGVGTAAAKSASSTSLGVATSALETPAEKRAKRRATGRGVLTPKVQVFVQPPTSDVKATPGSLYDAQGFLK